MHRLAAAAFALVTLVACSTGPTASAEPSADFALSGRGSIAAGTARVRCELRIGRRSRISVDGKYLLPGAPYTARVVSGNNSAAAGARPAVYDEVEFDFDSNADDIAQGATSIARDFIVVNAAGPDVRAEILDASGAVVSSGVADCSVR